MRNFRIMPIGLLAFAITLSLFVFMFKLVSSERGEATASYEIAGIHFGPVDIPEEVEIKDRPKPPEPEPIKHPPPPPVLTVSKPVRVQPEFLDIELPDLVNTSFGDAGSPFGVLDQSARTAEGDIIPIVVIRPMYPREAALRELEGWVIVEFTISELGLVSDPRVIDADPPRVFNKAALRAIMKWKFKPRIVNGLPTERNATQKISFNLDRN